MKLSVIILTVLVALVPIAISQNACTQRAFTRDSFVCVCNATNCDFPGTIDAPSTTTEYTRVRSDRDTYRFDVTTGSIESTAATNSIAIHVNPAYQFQTMFGFGGAFTDSTGLNVNMLSEEAKDMYIRSYFAPEGIEYDVCRIPVAGSDFSTRPYSYDDVLDDVTLASWSLEPEDFDYKIPFIQKALEVSDREILLFGSPWAPPAWMKESGMTNGSGGLKMDMWDPYSNYLVKFIEAYESYNIPIWGMTPQNEPLTGAMDWPWNTCEFNETVMRDWIGDSFGPIMTAAGLRRVKLMVFDQNRDALPSYPATSLEDPLASDYIDGTAVHWYEDHNFGPAVLTELHEQFKDKFILYTEACEGWYEGDRRGVLLGDWERAENYSKNILEDVNNWSTGWVDWNMALDLEGGPNWAGNLVDSPILINPSEDEFFKQPTFYAMGHFSKFILPGAIRIYTNLDEEYSNTFSAASFKNPDGTAAIVVLNRGDAAETVSIETGNGTYINIDMTPKSLETILITL